MSFAAVARHVAMLEHAGLIVRDVRGREHWLSLRAEGLRDADAWMAEQSCDWSARSDALGGDGARKAGTLIALTGAARRPATRRLPIDWRQCRQAGGHWFEPSSAHRRKAPLTRGSFLRH